MSDLVSNNREFLEVLILFFKSKKTGCEVHQELQKVDGDWLYLFKEGDLDVDDHPH